MNETHELESMPPESLSRLVWYNIGSIPTLRRKWSVANKTPTLQFMILYHMHAFGGLTLLPSLSLLVWLIKIIFSSDKTDLILEIVGVLLHDGQHVVKNIRFSEKIEKYFFPKKFFFLNYFPLLKRGQSYRTFCGRNLRIFVTIYSVFPDKPFQSNLMFAGKAKSLH